MSDQVRHRRRGEELEHAVLNAAWDELVDVGFASLTMESVAARAKTGVAVLYRRWPNKDELVMAALQHYGRTRRIEIPDTGTLRGDMLALLGNVSEGRTSFTTVITATFAGLLANSGLTPAQVRERILDDRPLWSEEIYGRAVKRGEIDLDRVPPAVLAMPFELMRHDLLMTLRPVPPERIKSIVDDLYIPLVAAHMMRFEPAATAEPGRGEILEQCALALDAAHGVVVQHQAADAAILGQRARLRLYGLRGEHAPDRAQQRVPVQQFQVPRELLSGVDAGVALELDGHVRAIGVTAHDVDRADRGGVLTADQPVAVAEQVELLGQQFLQVRLDAVLDQPRVDAEIHRGVGQGLADGDGQRLAGLVGDGPLIRLLGQPAGW
jgi:AcrR family transcriptional regulator